VTPLRVTPEMLDQHARHLDCTYSVSRAPEHGWQVTVSDRLLRHHRRTLWGARRLAWAEMTQAAVARVGRPAAEPASGITLSGT
jgi:hypothetical protein